MPIANCIVTPECYAGADNSVDLVGRWSALSAKSPEHMTVNIVVSNEQFGSRYDVMVNLQLPSLWSLQDVALLQRSLVQALAEYYAVPLAAIHLCTHILESGTVVENGDILAW